MAVMTVPNVETDNATGKTVTTQLSAAKTAAPASLRVIILSMVAVAAAIVGMWFAYKHVLKPTAIGFAQNYVPYAGVIAVTAALERLLEPLSQLIMPTSSQKATAAASKSQALTAGADPAKAAGEVQPLVQQAATDQAGVDTQRTNRTVLFWAIASICGVGISGGFGLLLLQSIAHGHVNSFLDLAVTGLTIGAGTKPTHDLITSLQTKAGSSS